MAGDVKINPIQAGGGGGGGSTMYPHTGFCLAVLKWLAIG